MPSHPSSVFEPQDQHPLTDLLPPEKVAQQVAEALAEDLGVPPCDHSAALLPNTQATGRIWAREAGILCGAPWVNEAWRQHMPDSAASITWHKQDGDAFQANEALCTLQGPAPALLRLERTLLNFLQTLSGTATTTHAYVQALAGTHTRVLDTRKTLPGWRLAQKYAVRCGGGHNHRLGLHDRLLLKENHIQAAGGIAQVLEGARKASCPRPHHIEVTSLEELAQAAEHGADVVLLDNFSLAMMRQAVSDFGQRVRLEASGGLSLEGLQAVAQTGVHDLSVGALTKHLRAIDLSFLFEA